MANGTYENELDMQSRLALARNVRQREEGTSRMEHLREQIKEHAKQEVKQRAKQQAKKLAAQAGRALARVLLQLVLQAVRMVIVFLVATPPGWVVDILIVAVILSIIVVANPGGVLTLAKNIGCGAAEYVAPGGRVVNPCDAGEWLFGAGKDVGGFLGGLGGKGKRAW